MKRHIALSAIFVMATAIAVSARQNIEPSTGFVTVQDDVNAVLCNNKGEQFTIKGSKEPVQLPVGRYCINNWTLERTDKNGTLWKLTSKDIAHKKAFDVAKGTETKLPMGEPIISNLIVWKENSEFYFRHYLKGQLGEEIKLTKSRSRADPPKLLIRNENSSYQELLTFKYG
jgi:hypothetical protein